jgi:type IV secretion system protein VirB11
MYSELLIERSLAPLMPFLNPEQFEEIVINRPQELWIKYRHKQQQKGWHACHIADLTYDFIKNLCQKLSNINQLPFISQGVPILATTILGGHRLQAMIGTNVRYDAKDRQGVALAIRLFNKNQSIKFEDFGLSHTEHSLTPTADTHKRHYYDSNPLTDLLHAIDHGEAILISGATSTGKTSFLNLLLKHIPEHKRVITIEDAREIHVPHPNRIHLLTSRTESLDKADYQALLDVVVRLTPDILIAGEVSMKNASGIYRLMTTGHTNFMATIHASSPEEALQAFCQNLSLSQHAISTHHALTVMHQSIGRIVQIQRNGDIRSISAITIPNYAIE